MEKIKIGKIVNAVALHGEVKVYSYSDRKERYEALKEILVEQKRASRRMRFRTCATKKHCHPQTAGRR